MLIRVILNQENVSFLLSPVFLHGFNVFFLQYLNASPTVNALKCNAKACILCSKMMEVVLKKNPISSNLHCFIRYIFQQKYSAFPYLGGTNQNLPKQNPMWLLSDCRGASTDLPSLLSLVSCFDLQPEPQVTVLFTVMFLGAWVI